MDLFELFVKKPDVHFTTEEALMMVAICASAADNKPSEEEVTRTVALGLGHPMFPHDDIGTLNKKADRLLHLLLKLG
ncbi:MAG: hypothetical protein JW821_14585 [Deltaproteobacteria bacterium]|nr:hypothetical protein [Deltaproteobacteria bacterium]